MALIRIRCDLAIPKKIANKPAVKAKLVELYNLLKLAKSYAIKINEGLPNEEMTIWAGWHICHHDTGGSCEPEQEV